MSDNPIDLLPIKRPIEEDVKSKTYFYDNVISKLIPDMIRMEATGIPISLDKVDELEEVLSNVLETVKQKLESNELVKEFLSSYYKEQNKKELDKFKEKNKVIEDFLVPFNSSNTVHRSWVVNTYLKKHNKPDMVMDKWTVTELKKLAYFIESKFLNDLISGNILPYMEDIVNEAMYNLAETKCKIYNKNRISKKTTQLEIKNIPDFNPASPIQKTEFFKMLSIESEKETLKGNPQWDRNELERLQKLLNEMLS